MDEARFFDSTLRELGTIRDHFAARLEAISQAVAEVARKVDVQGVLLEKVDERLESQASEIAGLKAAVDGGRQSSGTATWIRYAIVIGAAAFVSAR